MSCDSWQFNLRNLVLGVFRDSLGMGAAATKSPSSLPVALLVHVSAGNKICNIHGFVNSLRSIGLAKIYSALEDGEHSTVPGDLLYSILSAPVTCSPRSPFTKFSAAARDDCGCPLRRGFQEIHHHSANRCPRRADARGRLSASRSEHGAVPGQPCRRQRSPHQKPDPRPAAFISCHQHLIRPRQRHSLGRQRRLRLPITVPPSDSAISRCSSYHSAARPFSLRRRW